MPCRGWFKGADTTSMLKFLEKKLTAALPHIPDENKLYFTEMHAVAASANRFLSLIYHSSFWLSDRESNDIIRNGRMCLDKFLKCAETAYSLGLTRWKLQPKFHLIGEMVFELEVRKEAGLPNVNPLVFSNQQDEDFVGRVATFSRHVSSRTIHERTLSRYQISLGSKW